MAIVPTRIGSSMAKGPRVFAEHEQEHRRFPGANGREDPKAAFHF